MADLKLIDITKRFGSLTVIPRLNLEIADGEFLVLVGPSGCGKSTLLRMIAGLEEVSGGDLMIRDQRANDLPPQKRNIAMVFQSYALFPHMTVHGNIAFGPRIRREPKPAVEEGVRRAGGILNLLDYLGRLPRQLSGGQRQRVAMGRAIVRDPAVFLFDEPLSNLDAKLRVQMRTEIKFLHQKVRSTVVYVTHDQIEAMTMADRIVVMNAGHIEQIGSPLELYDRPANRFVAGFIGSPAMSFLPGIFRAANSQVELTDGNTLSVAGTGIAEAQPVTVGIRPERFRVTDAEAAVPLLVEVVEPTGSETHVTGTVAGEPIRCVFRERLDPAPGSRLPLAVSPEDVHLFDPADGRRL